MSWRTWNRFESPRRLDFRDSLRSSFASLTVVLASSGYADPPAPFNPTRVGESGSRSQAGLKGASRSGKTADASTYENLRPNLPRQRR
jgi:hypothetical protein